MDGFHFDDSVLEKRGLRPRKGAPETFDHALGERNVERRIDDQGARAGFSVERREQGGLGDGRGRQQGRDDEDDKTHGGQIA